MIITNNMSLYKVSYKGKEKKLGNGGLIQPEIQTIAESNIQRLDKAVANTAKASILMQEPKAGSLMHDFQVADKYPDQLNDIGKTVKKHIAYIEAAMPDIEERVKTLSERLSPEQIISLPPEILSMLEQDPDVFIAQFKKYLTEQIADVLIDEFDPKTVVTSKAVQATIEKNISKLRDFLDGEKPDTKQNVRYSYTLQALSELSENQPSS